MIECDGNKYGLGCENRCGNCSTGEQCHHVNGVCKNGCDVGVYGDKCYKGNSNEKKVERCYWNVIFAKKFINGEKSER